MLLIVKLDECNFVCVSMAAQFLHFCFLYSLVLNLLSKVSAYLNKPEKGLGDLWDDGRGGTYLLSVTSAGTLRIFEGKNGNL